MYWLRLPLLGASSYEEVEERALPEVEVLETSASQVLGNPNLLSEILRHLDSRSLCQSQAVCKEWKRLVESSQFRHDFFSSKWGLKKSVGEPRKAAYYLGAQLSQFVWQHPTGPSDSLMAVALRYGSDVATLRRLNNLPLSELSVQSRANIYIPVQQRSDLDGKYGHFLYDPIACREFVCVADTEMLEGSTLPRPINGAGGKPRWSEEDKAKKLSKMMAQALHISEQSARFYYDEAHGDLKAAYQKYDADKEWERTHPFAGKVMSGPSSL
ncbi:hypothetical protein WJX84_006095 [Apatococcus fuscideae]|uniref:F-box domain-containing protein n=1 Tax=Apatococcus fuscideae TaxID=2026836 RepID=A0AAW1SVY7_9CHLO